MCPRFRAINRNQSFGREYRKNRSSKVINFHDAAVFRRPIKHYMYIRSIILSRKWASFNVARFMTDTMAILKLRLHSRPFPNIFRSIACALPNRNRARVFLTAVCDCANVTIAFPIVSACFGGRFYIFGWRNGKWNDGRKFVESCRTEETVSK